jgi:modulator of FtsH protease
LSYQAADWQNYFIAQAGAAAALTGLIFVAVSLNLRQILQYPHLPGRAAQALITLLQLLMVAMMSLIPGQSAVALGIELMFVAIVAATAVAAIGRSNLVRVRDLPAEMRATQKQTLVLITGQLVCLPTILAGASLVAHTGGGLYWLVGTTAVALVSGVGDAWVLLVEVQR